MLPSILQFRETYSLCSGCPCLRFTISVGGRWSWEEAHRARVPLALSRPLRRRMPVIASSICIFGTFDYFLDCVLEVVVWTLAGKEQRQPHLILMFNSGELISIQPTKTERQIY